MKMPLRVAAKAISDIEGKWVYRLSSAASELL
jgi:hypothetical protein